MKELLKEYGKHVGEEFRFDILWREGLLVTRVNVIKWYQGMYHRNRIENATNFCS